MVLICGRIEYNKKPGKLAIVKTQKDPAVPRDDVYKSGTIRTGPGEPANSTSKPTPRPKQVAGKPITKGKLLRPGGPGGGPSKLAARPKPTPAPQPVAQPLPTATQQPTPVQRRAVPQPAAAVAANHNRTGSTASQRAPPPPPPAAPPQPKKDTAKVLYDFASERSNELSITKGEIVQIMSREGNGKHSPKFLYGSLLKYGIGWWLCMNLTTNAQGWTPQAYLEEIVAPAPAPVAPPPPPAPPAAPRTATPNGTSRAGAGAAAKAKPPPPAPPAKRPMGRKPPPPAAPRDSAVSMNSGTNSQQDSSGGSGRATPSSMNSASFAGGLAEALRARQSAMHGKQDDDDDW